MCPAEASLRASQQKKIKDISPELTQGEVERIAKNYVMYSSWFKEDTNIQP